MSQTNLPIQAASLFAGGGEMGALMRSQDWSQTLFGPTHTWPQNLQIVVRILLASRFPIQILWGPDYALLYNDAYLPILGKKHPSSLGKSGREVWQEVWDFTQPRLEQVRATGQAIGADDQLLLLEREGHLEECYFTYSYTPIFDESGRVSGILNEVTETTQRVLDDRRQRLRNNLAIQTAKANTTDDVCQFAAQALGDGLEDVPFALFYLLQPEKRNAGLVSTTGVSSDRPESSELAPTVVELDHENPTPHPLARWLAQVMQTGESGWINPIDTCWQNLPKSPWGLPPQSALVLPLNLSGQQELLGFLVTGISPYRMLDQEYQNFFDGIRNHVSLTLARAKAYQEERQRVEALAQLNRAKETAQAVLREQAQLLDLALDAILVRDLNNIITYWNQGAEETYGWTAAEAIGQNVHELLQAQFLLPLAEIDATLLQTGRWQGEVTHSHKDGSPVIVMGRWVLKRNKVGEPVAVLAVNHDITQRKLAESNLKESEERFRTLANNIPQLAWMADAKGYLFWYNQRWFDYTGTTLEEMQGWQWQAIHHPDHVDRVVQKFRHHLETGETWEDTFPLRSCTGEYRWFLSRAFPIHDQQGNVLRWFGTNTDITEQRQAEQEREALLVREQVAREQAEAANRIKDEFLAVLSHELRSPLNPILGWAKLLQTREFDQAGVKRALETIERNAQLQAQLIEDLLDVSRILRGKLSLHPVSTNLSAIVKTAVESIRLAAEAKSIALTATLQTYPNHSPVYIFGDEARLQQIFWNLLSNAIKFTPEGGRVEVKLESCESSVSKSESQDSTQNRPLKTQNSKPTTQNLQHYAQITITDTGKGIDPDFLPYVFDRFRQEDGKTTRQFGGLGLGLAIARYLTELHGGTIWAESKGEGLGATFVLRLPLQHKAILPVEESPVSGQQRSLAILEGVRILAVDDEADMCDLLATILEQTGASIRLANSAKKALEIFDHWQPDLLISDIGMPDMDGLMLMQQIRQRSQEQGGQIPAIALTAYASEVNQSEAFSAGFQQHLAKPVDPDDLMAAIIQLLPA